MAPIGLKPNPCRTAILCFYFDPTGLVGSSVMHEKHGLTCVYQQLILPVLTAGSTSGCIDHVDVAQNDQFMALENTTLNQLLHCRLWQQQCERMYIWYAINCATLHTYTENSNLGCYFKTKRSELGFVKKNSNIPIRIPATICVREKKNLYVSPVQVHPFACCLPSMVMVRLAKYWPRSSVTVHIINPFAGICMRAVWWPRWCMRKSVSVSSFMISCFVSPDPS